MRRKSSKSAVASKKLAETRFRARGASKTLARIPAELSVVKTPGGLLVEIQRTDRDRPHRHMVSFTISKKDAVSKDRAIIVYGDFKEELRNVLR